MPFSIPLLKFNQQLTGWFPSAKQLPYLILRQYLNLLPAVYLEYDDFLRTINILNPASKMEKNELKTCHTLPDEMENSGVRLSSSRLERNFQNFQNPKNYEDDFFSRHLIETECTSNHSEHSNKDHHCEVDAEMESPAVANQKKQFEKIDFQSSTICQPAIQNSKSKWSICQEKLIAQFKSTIKIDKYLRLVSSIIKTRRAYKPTSTLTGVYKEIILTRRVIRWESKYDTIISLFQNEEHKSMIAFKIMQLIGDLVDLSSFWLRIIHKGTDKQEKLIEKLEQIEGNFYFAECCIWFAVYTYRCLAQKAKSLQNVEESKEARKKTIENLLKAIKYIMDILTSYNNSSLKKVFGQINHKLAGYLTFLSSAIGIFLLWR